MTDLYSYYKFGGEGEKDPVQALTYLLVFDEAMKQRGNPPSQVALDRQQKGLSPEQVAAAKAAAAEIIQACCQANE